MLEDPGGEPFGQRRAEIAGFSEALGGNRLGREDCFGGLRGGVHDHSLRDPFQPPAVRDAVELALGVFAIGTRADDRRIGAAFEFPEVGASVIRRCLPSGGPRRKLPSKYGGE